MKLFVFSLLLSFSSFANEPSYFQRDLNQAISLQTICNGVDRGEAYGGIIEFEGDRLNPNFLEVLKTSPVFINDFSQLDRYVRTNLDNATLIVEVP